MASLERPASARPSVDLTYSVYDFEFGTHLDSQFLYRRFEGEMVRHGSAGGGRTLDVACGSGQLLARLRSAGVEAWGIDSSREMLGINHWLHTANGSRLIRGIGESLPFQAESFDLIICQGSLDHFVDPHAFMLEAARILRPDGRIIIVLANYESLSCRLGRLLHGLARDVLRRPQHPHRPYWQVPLDHYHKGELAFVRQLGNNSLRLERCYGISLLCLTYYWGQFVDFLPRRLAESLLKALDRIAHQSPALADMIISIWQPLPQEAGTPPERGLNTIQRATRQRKPVSSSVEP